MKKARRTIRKHFDEIINSFIYGFSNGPIEGSNNKIKAIKRTAYGFRSFKNFRLHILISFKNSFYSMNYKGSTIFGTDRHFILKRHIGTFFNYSGTK